MSYCWTIVSLHAIEPTWGARNLISTQTKAEEKRIVDQRQQLADVVRRAAERVQGHRKTWRRLDGPERGFQGGVLLDGVHGGRPPQSRREPQLRVKDGSLPRQSFALQYNTSLLDGWVKQFSPSCAAGCVAGSWNALMGLKRSDPGALSCADVLAVYREMLEASCAKKRGRIERMLGAPIAIIDAALRESLDAAAEADAARARRDRLEARKREREHESGDAPAQHAECPVAPRPAGAGRLQGR